MCSLLYWRRFFLKPSIVRKSVCFVFQDFGQQWNSIFTTRHIYKFEGIKYFVRILIFSDTNFHYSRTSRHGQLTTDSFPCPDKILIYIFSLNKNLYNTDSL